MYVGNQPDLTASGHCNGQPCVTSAEFQDIRKSITFYYLINYLVIDYA